MFEPVFILKLRRFIYGQSQDLAAYLSEKLKKLRQPIKSKDLPKKEQQRLSILHTHTHTLQLPNAASADIRPRHTKLVN